MYKSSNNFISVVGQDSKATQNALMTARINYKPNENIIRTQSKHHTVCLF